MLLLLLALTAALPTILSTSAVQKRLRAALGNTLQREVSWSALRASWSEGLRLEGLALGAGPAPLLQLAVGEVSVAPGFGFRHGRPRIALRLSCRDVSVAAAPAPAPAQPATAPPPPSPADSKPGKDPLTALAEALQNFERMDWPLPVDLAVEVAIAPVTLRYHDAESGRRLALDNLALRLELPSLAKQPIGVALRSELAVDGHPLQDIALTVDLKQLVTAARRIRPAEAVLALKAKLPGVDLALEGGIGDPQGFTTRLRADLPRIMAAYGPLLPPATPKVEGTLALDLRARPDAARNLHIAAQVAGTRLAVEGGPLGAKRLGPLDVRLRQTIVSDRQQQQVRLIEGDAEIDRWLSAAWQAVVERPTATDRELTARFGPLRIDLQQALKVAAPLLPTPSPVRELTGEVTLQQVTAQLHGDSNRGHVALENLALSLPRVRLPLAQGAVAAYGLELRLDKVALPLAAMRPAGAEVLLGYGLKRCAVSGPQAVVAENLRGSLRLALQDLDLASDSPRKVSARAELKESLHLGRVAVEGKLALTGLQQNLTTRIAATQSGAITVDLPQLTVAAAGLQAAAGQKQLGPLPLSAEISVAGVRLEAAKGAPPRVARATCTLAAGDFLRLSANGALDGGTTPRAASDGSIHVDFGQLLAVAAPLLPAGAAADGTLALDWKVAAPTAPTPLPSTDNPLVKARAALGMLDRAELRVALDGRDLRWPLQNGSFSLAYLFTERPLQVIVPANGGPLTLGGKIGFAGLANPSAAAAELPLHSGTFALQGELAAWRRLTLRETFKAAPFGMVHQAAVTVDGLDRLLAHEGPLTPSLLLRRLDARTTVDVAAHFPDTLTPVAGGAKLCGASRAHLGLDLRGGQNLQLQASAHTRDLGVGLANGTSVEGMQADLAFERRYALSGQAAKDWSPLSLSLVRPLPETPAPAGEAQIAGRVREDLGGRERGSQRFTIRKITVPNGATPLELTALQGDLRLDPEAMGLGFFQGNLLGGTVRLRGMIDLLPDTPAIAAACSFSNLQTLQLLPPAVRRQHAASGQESAITGQMAFGMPLHTGQRDLLEALNLDLSLRKIGTDTLERALYSLDPYERNEQIVGQRKLLRHGGLQALRARIVDGAFGLQGDVRVEGMTIALPKVERVRLSELPIRQQMTAALGGIAALRKLLDIARADTLEIEPDETFSLIRRGHE